MLKISKTNDAIKVRFNSWYQFSSVVATTKGPGMEREGIKQSHHPPKLAHTLIN